MSLTYLFARVSIKMSKLMYASRLCFLEQLIYFVHTVPRSDLERRQL